MAHLAQIEAQYCQCFLSVFCKLQSVMRNNYYKSGFYPTSSYVQCIWLGKEYGLPLFCQPLLFPSPCCIDLKQQKLGGGLGMRLYCCSICYPWTFSIYCEGYTSVFACVFWVVTFGIQKHVDGCLCFCRFFLFFSICTRQLFFSSQSDRQWQWYLTILCGYSVLLALFGCAPLHVFLSAPDSLPAQQMLLYCDNIL